MLLSPLNDVLIVKLITFIYHFRKNKAFFRIHTMKNAHLHTRVSSYTHAHKCTLSFTSVSISIDKALSI